MTTPHAPQPEDPRRGQQSHPHGARSLPPDLVPAVSSNGHQKSEPARTQRGVVNLERALLLLTTEVIYSHLNQLGEGRLPDLCLRDSTLERYAQGILYRYQIIVGPAESASPTVLLPSLRSAPVPLQNEQPQSLCDTLVARLRSLQIEDPRFPSTSPFSRIGVFLDFGMISEMCSELSSDLETESSARGRLFHLLTPDEIVVELIQENDRRGLDRLVDHALSRYLYRDNGDELIWFATVTSWSAPGAFSEDIPGCREESSTLLDAAIASLAPRMTSPRSVLHLSGEQFFELFPTWREFSPELLSSVRIVVLPALFAEPSAARLFIYRPAGPVETLPLTLQKSLEWLSLRYGLALCRLQASSDL